MNKVKQNLFWAFAYNTAGIPIGAGLLYPFFSLIVSPELAAFFMAISSVSVTLNTLLLKGYVPSIKSARGGQPGGGLRQPALEPVAVAKGARDTVVYPSGRITWPPKWWP